MWLSKMVGCAAVGSGQLVWHSMYSLLNTPAPIQRSVKVRPSLLPISPSHDCDTSAFHFGVAPVIAPAPSIGVVPGTPGSEIEWIIREARPRKVTLPGKPKSLRFLR